MTNRDYKQDFVNGINGRAYLAIAAECPSLKVLSNGFESYLQDKSFGERGRPAFFQTIADCKESCAKLLNVRSEDISLVSSTSEGINAIALSLPLRPGDCVVIDDLEFPSNILPWLRLRQEGVTVKIIRSQNGCLPLELVESALDSSTRLVALSFVSFVSGYRQNLDRLAKIVHSNGALLLVDATQGLGVFRVDAEKLDFLVCSTYKWLLGPHGLGILYTNRAIRERISPRSVGWYSVPNIFTDDRFERYVLKPDGGRFEIGMPPFPAIYALKASLGYLESIGSDLIKKKVLSFSKQLVEGCQRKGIPFLGTEEEEHRSGIVSVLTDRWAEAKDRLNEAGVDVWAGDGRVRASAHFFNTEEDIDKFLDIISSFVSLRHT